MIRFYGAMTSVAALMVSACAHISTPTPTQTGPETAFRPCEDQARFSALSDSLCATLAAPLTYQTGDEAKLDIFVRKFPAKNTHVGEIWLLAGGPGEAGTSYYSGIEAFRDAFPGYDVFIPDHRGTGRSERLCAGETPDSPRGTALTGEEFGPCFGEIWQNAPRTQAFSMTHAAKDLDLLMGQLSGEGHRYIYGVSYGTGYALRFSQVSDQALDGIILDSLVPALTDTRYDISHRSLTTDMVGQRVIAQCAQSPECNARFEGGIETAFSGLIAAIDAGERPDLAELSLGGHFKHALGSMLDIPASRALISDAIALALYNPSELSEFFETQVTPTYAIFQELAAYDNSAFSITLAGLIGHSETNRRPEQTAQDVAREEMGLGFTAALTTVQTYTQMPTYVQDDYFAAPYAHLPPILVLQGDMDPKTPLEGALTHIEALKAGGAEVTLVTVKDSPHAVWFFAPQCRDEALERFMAHSHPQETLCRVSSER